MKKILLLLLLIGVSAQATTQYYPWVNPAFGGDLDSIRYVILQDTTVSDSLVAQGGTFPRTDYIPYSDTSKVTIKAYKYFNADTTAWPAEHSIDNVVSILAADHGTGTWGSGTGSNTHIVRVYDTLNSVYVPGAVVSIYSMGGTSEAVKPTNSSGEYSFNLSLDSFKFVADFIGYEFETDTTLVAGNDTTVIEGKQAWSAPSVPSSANLCKVYGILYDNKGDAIPGAEIQFVCPTKVVDTCSDAIILPYTIVTGTNDTGYFEQELLMSSCIDNQAYKVVIIVNNEYGHMERKEETLVIPSDSTTYRLKY